MEEMELMSMTEVIVATVHPGEIILFGSYAKGFERPDSDVDLLVVVPDSEKSRKRRHMTGRLYRSLSSYPVAKDTLVFIRSEFEHWREVPGHIVATSFQEGRRLYARS